MEVASTYKMCSKCGGKQFNQGRINETEVKNVQDVKTEKIKPARSWGSLIVPTVIYLVCIISGAMAVRPGEAFGGALFVMILGTPILLVAGLVKPTLVLNWGGQDRKTVLLSYVGILIVMLAFLIAGDKIEAYKHSRTIEETLIGSWSFKLENNVETAEDLAARILMNMVMKNLKMDFFDNGNMKMNGSVFGFSQTAYLTYDVEADKSSFFLVIQEDGTDKAFKSIIKVINNDEIILKDDDGGVISLCRVDN